MLSCLLSRGVANRSGAQPNADTLQGHFGGVHPFVESLWFEFTRLARKIGQQDNSRKTSSIGLPGAGKETRFHFLMERHEWPSHRLEAEA